MTNEQLAVLLDSYSGRLETILDDIEPGLPDGVTRMNEWWHDGKKVSTMRLVGLVGANPFGDRGRESLESQGYELRPTGDAYILDGLRRFISDLRETVSLLSSDGEAWKTS